MKNELKRQVYSWLLLSVFVPMMALAALHVHEDFNDPEISCQACVNHQSHAGHLINALSHLHDCVLCQLHSISFLLASFAVLPILIQYIL